MPGMKWVRLWTAEVIFGTTSHELNYKQRGIWFQFLALGGLPPVLGKICLSATIGYTNEQLSELLVVPIDLLMEVKELLASKKCKKIKVDDKNIITIINWKHYQSPYGRVVKSREKKKQQGDFFEKGKDTTEE